MSNLFSIKPCNFSTIELKSLVYIFFNIRNLALFLFMEVHDSIDNGHGRVRTLWKCIGLLSRAYSLPDKEFKQFDTPNMKMKLVEAARKVIVLVKAIYGPFNCTYNLHSILHLRDIRKKGPLPSNSTFNTEGYYGLVRKSVRDKPSSNIGKQVIQHTYLTYRTRHKCQRSMYFDEKDKKKSSDKYFYVYTGSQFKPYRFFTIESIDDDKLICDEMITERLEKEDPQSDSFPFAHVGVYKFIAQLRSPLVMRRQDVSGKAVVVGELVMSIPTDTLFECS